MIKVGDKVKIRDYAIDNFLKRYELLHHFRDFKIHNREWIVIDSLYVKKNRIEDIYNFDGISCTMEQCRHPYCIQNLVLINSEHYHKNLPNYLTHLDMKYELVHKLMPDGSIDLIEEDEIFFSNGSCIFCSQQGKNSKLVKTEHLRSCLSASPSHLVLDTINKTAIIQYNIFNIKYDIQSNKLTNYNDNSNDQGLQIINNKFGTDLSLGKIIDVIIQTDKIKVFI